MGKLGGRELNYSSDVDLMLLYDPAVAAYHADRAGACYVRLARDLVRLLDERTAEGYVFRTDLRLRPDPAATPLAVSVNAAIVYYESMGQNWERAAMIKARPVAGDRALGEHFLREIRPFVWRRHLDFAAVADIHSIKRQIHVHKGAQGAGATIALAGHDVKLGRGGIREIEFTAQVLQLIWGGRDPALRDPTTLGALAALAAAGRLDRAGGGGPRRCLCLPPQPRAPAADGGRPADAQAARGRRRAGPHRLLHGVPRPGGIRRRLHGRTSPGWNATTRASSRPRPR